MSWVCFCERLPHQEIPSLLLAHEHFPYQCICIRTDTSNRLQLSTRLRRNLPMTSQRAWKFRKFISACSKLWGLCLGAPGRFTKAICTHTCMILHTYNKQISLNTRAHTYIYIHAYTHILSPLFIYIYICVYGCTWYNIYTCIHKTIEYTCMHTYIHACIALHCIALRCVALHYITLHYITLHTYIIID